MLGFRDSLCKQHDVCRNLQATMPCMTLQMQADLYRRHSVAAFSSVTQQRPCVLRHRQTTRCQAVATNLLSRTQQSTGVEREEVPHYAEGAQFLKSIGFQHTSEVSKVLDVAMNPNSLYLKDRHKRRAVNVNARRLSVQEDMQPVCNFLQSQGLSQEQVVEVIMQHPPVLSYSIENRLQPFMSFLREIGIVEPAQTVLQRPTLLGLDADKNLRAIVGYLQENGHSAEDIAHLLQTSV